MNDTNTEPVIYIVDDEPLLGEMAEALLATEGWQARVFINPINALETFRAAAPRPCLLITDCVMREMNGIELIKSCRDVVPELKTILLSGTVAEDYVQGQRTQPDLFIHKPYRAETLLRAVRDLLPKETAVARP